MDVDGHVEKLKETKLWNYLKSIDEDYSKRAVQFVENISPILNTIKIYFPYYTRHDAHHGYRVILRMEQIINPECIEANSPICFSRKETFLLICSAYAHDLGMTIFLGEEDQLLTELGINKEESWEINKNLQKHLRVNHSQRGGRYINDNKDSLGIPENLISFLHNLMKSHNLSIHKLEAELGERVAVDEREIDLKQLACILCIADAIEFSDTRVIDGVLTKIKNDSSEEALVSYRENMKHICIGDNVAIGDDGKVIFSGSFNEPEILNLAHTTIDTIENWVQQYCDIDYRSSKKRLRLRPDSFIRTLDSIDFDFVRLGVRMKKENVINLISSNSLWKNNEGIPIKELLQNAVEACRYRKHNTPENRNYKPKITVTFDRNNSKITIIDNGCGMDRNIILNNFLTVGNSRAFEPTYASHGYNSLARFGIGFWSVFTIASKVYIESAPFELLGYDKQVDEAIDGCKFEISINVLKDYTVFQPLKRPAGTKIELFLKKGISLDNAIVKFKNEILCTEIPVEVIDPDNNKYYLPDNPVLLKYSDIFRAKTLLAKENQIELFAWSNKADEIDFAMNVAYRKQDNGKTTFFLKDSNNSIQAIKDIMLNPKIGICGFNINSSFYYNSICFDIHRVGYFTVNSNNPKGFIFDISRNTLLYSKEKTKLELKILNFIHNGYREFLKTNNSFTPEEIYNLNIQSRIHGGNGYDSYTKDSFSIIVDNFPDLYCIKLYKIEKNKEISKTEVIYVDFKNILTISGTIWTCQHILSKSYIDPLLFTEAVYNYIRESGINMGNNYLLEPYKEGSILFDNAEKSEVVVINGTLKPHNTILELKLIKIPINSIISNTNHKWIIAKIDGKWSGTIYEKKITVDNIKTSNRKTRNFVFMGRNRLVILKDSVLANDIKTMYSEGKIYSLSELIYFLEQAEHGNIDDSIKKYLD